MEANERNPFAGSAPVDGVQRVDIDQKMRGAYLSYAMSVITARALPDVRDGLKPVQRRILYAMWDMGLRHDQPTRKSARIVGEVLGKYHPHGDSAVYDAMVRMAQDFSMRYPLVDGQGNFGSVDGDGAAALRYTEARLSAIGEELLLDLDKDTVDRGENFDGSLQEPLVLPAKVPNLLVNGVGGIAVGMATNIPPHNLSEVVDAVCYLIDRYDKAEDVSVDDLLRLISGPDFPTGGSILGDEGIRQAYATGRGRVVVRAQAHVEDMRAGHSAIVVTELPYQVNKAGLVERIAELWRNGRVDGVSDLRDESDRTGMRIVIELKRGADPSPVLGNLLKYTQMQTTFGVHMLALVDGEPRVLSLKRLLLHYIDHRREVIERRSRYELEKARARAHILEGLIVALDNLDAVIETIRRSQTVETAERNLIARFKLSEIQARAILDMMFRRLAALERKKIEEEYAEVKKRIAYLQSLLESKAKILALIKEDALDLKQRFGDARRTRITDHEETAEFAAEDLVPDEDLWVVLTRKGLARRLPAAQRAAARGAEAHSVPGMVSGERDTVHTAFVVNCRESIIFVTDSGRALKLPGHQLPDATQQPRGLALTNLVHLAADEHIASVLHLDETGPKGYLTLGTRQGKVKRLEVSEVTAMVNGGAQVIGLADGDTVVWAAFTSGEDEILIVSAQGHAIRIQEDTVRPQGRSGTGVRGITLADDDVVVSGEVVRPGEVALVTEQGYAKRTPLDEYGVQGRGGQGIMAVDGNKLAMTGPVVAARVVQPGDEIAFATTGGSMVHIPVSSLAALGRMTWGRLVTRTRNGALIQEGAIAWAARLEAPQAHPSEPAPAPKEPSGGGPRRATSNGSDSADGPVAPKGARGEGPVMPASARGDGNGRVRGRASGSSVSDVAPAAPPAKKGASAKAAPAAPPAAKDEPAKASPKAASVTTAPVKGAPAKAAPTKTAPTKTAPAATQAAPATPVAQEQAAKRSPRAKAGAAPAAPVTPPPEPVAPAKAPARRVARSAAPQAVAPEKPTKRAAPPVEAPTTAAAPSTRRAPGKEPPAETPARPPRARGEKAASSAPDAPSPTREPERPRTTPARRPRAEQAPTETPPRAEEPADAPASSEAGAAGAARRPRRATPTRPPSRRVAHTDD